MPSESDDSSIAERIKQSLPRCAFLYAVLLAYLILGGVLFNLLEFEAREEDVENGTQELDEERNVLISALWAETVAKSEEDWAIIANDRLDIYENVVKEYYQQGIDSEYESDNEWNLIGSIFYCFTVVTTIGYGSPAPSTVAGKIATVIYGLIGIPLALIFLGEVGKFLTLILKSVMKRCSSVSCDDSDEFNFGPIAAVLITFSYLIFGAAFFDYLEDDWDMVDATYFSFITVSTIGFGDLNLESHSIQLLIMLYTLGALSLCGMCLVVIQQALEAVIDEKHQAMSDWWAKRAEAREEAKHKKDDDDKASYQEKPSPANQFCMVGQEEEEEEEVEDVEVEEQDEE